MNEFVLPAIVAANATFHGHVATTLVKPLFEEE